MKKVLLLAAVMLAAGATGTLAAQPGGQLGVRAGVTSQDLELRTADFDGDYFATDARMGFHVAAVSRIRLVAAGNGALGVGLFFQPEIVYSQNNYKMQKNGAKGASTIRMQSVDVPVLLSVKLSIVRVQAGPMFNVMYKNGTMRGDVEIFPVRRPAVGYSVGASVDIFGGLVLDGRFNGQSGELKNNIEAGETVYRSVRGSLSSWSIGLSCLF